MPEYSEIYETAVDRITSSYSTCSPAEQKLMMQILQEMSKTGYSYTLEQVWLSDFTEIPVGIDQFLDDPYYLGQTNNFGANIYPFWRKTFKEIFNAGNRYNEVILSGATRLGKTSSSVTMMAYMLYKLMLYRNPHEYFQKKAISKFTLGFANLTKELAFSVAYREFNDTLKEVPWFMDRGKVTKSDRNFYYVPQGDKIEIIAASSGEQMLGKQVWCLHGNTKIVTRKGTFKISELEHKTVEVLQYNYLEHRFEYAAAQVEMTAQAARTKQIMLSNGYVLEGTTNHSIMLEDGKYSELSNLSNSDKLFAIFNRLIEIDLSIIQLEDMHYFEPIPVYDVINAGDLHNFIIDADGMYIVSHNCAIIDEANFAKTGVKDISIAKNHMKNLYDTVNARISGTFRIGGEVYGKLFTSSSKNQDNDYLSEHIETQQRAGNEHLYLVDEPQWKVLPKSMFSDEVFHFTVGDRYKRGFVIPEENDDEAHRQEYLKQGYQVIEAPAEFRKNFLADYDIALRDIAGISVAGAMGFITQESITPCVALDRVNPFYQDILTIGKDDDLQISDFFHLNEVPQDLKYQQMNIHLDLAETHNRTGISGCCVFGNKVVETDEGKKVALPYIKQIFSVLVEAPRGGRMSFQKVINFIVWLRQNHFNVGTVSTDQYQSSFLRETLSQQGFNTKKYSIDMDAYISLRNLLVDQRIELINHQYQEDELIKTQRMNNTIHHPEDDGGGHGDAADALAGSSYSLILEQVTAKPPARNIAAIAAAVNKGTGRAGGNPMSSANTVNRSSANTSNRPVHFPKLR